MTCDAAMTRVKSDKPPLLTSYYSMLMLHLLAQAWRIPWLCRHATSGVPLCMMLGGEVRNHRLYAEVAASKIHV